MLFLLLAQQALHLPLQAHLKNNFVFIIGICERENFIVFPHEETLCAIPNASSQSVPTATSLFNLKLGEDMDSLRSSSASFHPRNFVPVPSFLLDAIDNAITEFDGDAKEVLAVAAREIKSFDTANTNKDKFKDKGSLIFLILGKNQSEMETAFCGQGQIMVT